MEWILKAGGVVSRGTPNFFSQNERNARSAERCEFASSLSQQILYLATNLYSRDSFFFRSDRRGGSGDDAWLFGPESAGAGSNSELNSHKKLPGIRKSDFSQRRRASSVGATPFDIGGLRKNLYDSANCIKALY